MKKIKGSSGAVRMIHLVVLFCVTLVAGLGLRTYQLLDLVNPENGFYENPNFTVPVLYAVLAFGTVLFLILSFVSRNVPSPSLPEGRNVFLGISSLLAAAGFVWDIAVIQRDILPDSGIAQGVYDNLLLTYIKGSGGIFLILELIFAVLSAFYFVIFAVSHFEGKATYKKFGLLALSPACWTMFVLISKLMKAVSFITMSELLFEIAMLVFTMLFFFVFARIVSGVYTVNSMWATYGCGFAAAVFAALISVPRAIMLVVGLENVEGSEFSFTHLFIFVFITLYVLATLGVGFRNGMKKIRSVSNVVLPDDADVVVKGSDIAEISVVEEIYDDREEKEVVSDNKFKIDTDFKTDDEGESFFDNAEKSDEITVEEVENSTVAEAVEEYVENIEEKASESGNEDSAQSVFACDVEENPQETDEEAIEEIEEAFVETNGEMPSEESSEEGKEIVTENTITDDDGFELTEIFAEPTADSVGIETTEDNIDDEALITEESEAVETFEEIRETDGIVEPVEIEEVVTIEEVEEINEPEIIEEKEASSVSSGEDFVEFSQMLIDDFEEDEEIVEKVKDDKVEAPEIKEQPAVQEIEVKKEKAKKQKKTFGKNKKKSSEEEPLKIVSLAELRENKDSE
ncbi:MAG: hypothetical protein IJ025_02745 [Clostridia bacterium]|nr:hypothetical protein [Clostridia bacterium]